MSLDIYYNNTEIEREKLSSTKASQIIEHNPKNGKGLSLEERILKEKNEKEQFAKYWNDPEHDKTTHKVYFSDNRNMKQLQNNSVQLIVTSPPYYNAKEYSQWDSLEEYSEDLRSTFSECFRVLQPGRKFCLNISDIPVKGENGVKWLPLGTIALQVALDVGFELADRIIWFKTPIKGFQYGSLPYPASL